MKKKSIFILTLIIILSYIIYFNYYNNKSTNTFQSNASAEAASQLELSEVNNNSSSVTFISAGDILFHMPEVASAQENNTYNFNPMFSEVKDIISSADISAANFETTINPKRNLSGYPAFNTPVQALDALKATGFQVLLNDHNHTLDTGLDGLRSTNSLIKQYGFKVLGSGEPGEDKSVIVEKNNIKIGMLSYTYSTNYGVQYPDMINYIDEGKIEKEINNIKSKCDFLIVYLHLGTEYVRNVEDFQAALVKDVAKMGADAILCSHPHVARKTEMIYVNGKGVLVNYSMGNFISNQNDKYTDIGSMERMIIEKRNGIAKLKSAETIPVYRLRYSSNGKTFYKTVPCSNINKFKNFLVQGTIAYVNQVSKELIFNYAAPRFNYLERKPAYY
ncbi:MAG: Bacterial capsule synthesis protein cap [Clostridiaceae bacterium]|jgi:poly-gamma-glutamate synthesis protein (capsule biosynthesis protein)|nr:Bacterial capsule synthesis protein cap [Clostridiaceae bacterium]